MVFNYGQMVHVMKEHGGKTKLMGEESFGMLMGISLMVRLSGLWVPVGEWRDDKANGFGVYTHVNGAKYEG